MKWFFVAFFLAQTGVAAIGIQTGVDMRYKRQANQLDVFENFYAVGVDYSLNPNLSLGGELIYGEGATENGNFKVTEKEYNLLAWANLIMPKLAVFHPIMGVGLGFAQYDVDTRFAGETARSVGDLLPIYGVEFASRVNFADLVGGSAKGFINMSVRGLGGADYRPQPIWSIQAMIGMYL